MLRIKILSDLIYRLEAELRKAGSREMGGILLAEHLGGDEFVVREITFHRRGTFASFIRRIEEAWTTINSFFRKRGEDYRRYNYLGEWHSHPSFLTTPSHCDNETMREIVTDPSVGALFVILVIVKLDEGKLAGSARAYFPDGREEAADLILQI